MSEADIKQYLIKVEECVDKKDFNGAITQLDEAIEAFPESQVAWNYKGKILVYIGENEKGLACQEKVLLLNPQCAKAWFDKADALAQLERWDEVLECLHKCIDINPENEGALRMLAFYHYKKKDLEKSISYFDRAIEANPDDFMNHWDKGMILSEMGTGRKAEAVIALEDAVHLNPRNDNLWMTLALLYKDVGRIEDARKCLIEAANLNPANPHSIRAMLDPSFYSFSDESDDDGDDED